MGRTLLGHFIAIALSITLFSQTVYATDDTVVDLTPAKRCGSFRRRLAQIGVATVTLPIATCTAIEQIRKDSSSVRSTAYRDEDLGFGAVKVANYGDSLSTGFHVDEKLVSLDEMRTLRTTGSAFADPSDQKTFKSVFRRLFDQQVPTNAVTFARVGAAAVRVRPLTTLQKFASTMMDLEDQVSESLKENHFANLHLIWIGHNDLNWILDISEKQLVEAKHLARLPELFYRKFDTEVSRLIEKAITHKRKTAIILFALGDVSVVGQFRKEIEEIRKVDPSRYPFAHGLLQAFPALSPEYIDKTVLLAKAFNEKLELLVKNLSEKYKIDDNIQLSYSDAINKISPSLSNVSPLDGFHLSDFGREQVAGAVYSSKEFKNAVAFIR